MTEPLTYKESIAVSWYADDLVDIQKMLDALSKLPLGLSGDLVYYDSNGDKIATFWLNTEVEQWMVMPTIERS